jgi:hypothetical protein
MEVIGMSTYWKALACAVIALVAGLSGCSAGTSPAASEARDTSASASSEGTPSTAESTGTASAGTVQVTVSDLEGSQGGSVAGVLFSGSEAKFPDARVVGGFGVTVDADPFTTTQTVNEPGEELQGLFPYASTTPLPVVPGTYTLMLWAAPEALGPYSRWVPHDTSGLRGCLVTFEAAPGTGATLTVKEIPEWGGNLEADEAKCTTG